MSVFSNNLLLGAGGQSTGPAPFDPTLIGNSVWLDGSADDLDRSTTSHSSTECVMACWFQLNTFSGNVGLLGLGTGTSGSTNSGLWLSGGTVYFYANGNGATTNQLLRDIGWYHILASFKLDESTASNKGKLFINGEEVTSFATDPRSSWGTSFASTATQSVGSIFTNTFLNGYIAQPVMLDGQSIQGGDVAVSDFLDTFTFGTNGSQYVPKADADIAALATTAGGNSFCLDFADSADLGNDISSNANDFTANSMSSANQTTSTPSLVYPSLTNIIPASESSQGISTLTNGNLSVAAQTGRFARSAMIVNSTFSKLYYEVTFDTVDATYDYPRVGIALTSYTGNDLWSPGASAGSGYGLQADTSTVQLNGSTLGTYAGFSSGDVCMVAFDPATGKIWTGKNGTYFNSGDPAAGSGEVATITGDEWKIFVGGVALSGSAYSVNFGQSAFAHTVPTGFASLASSNLTAPDYQGIDYFDATLYEGNGQNQRVGDFVPFTDTFTVSKSAMFDNADRRYLARTYSAGDTARSGTTCTISYWIKYCSSANNQYVLSTSESGQTKRFIIYIDSSGASSLILDPPGSGNNRTFTVPGSFLSEQEWTNFVWQVDPDNATAADKVKAWVNGVQITSTDTSYQSASSSEYYLFDNEEHFVGNLAPASAGYTPFCLNSYLAELNVLDGQLKAPTDFGEVDTSTNRWIPKDYNTNVGTYGNRGFYMEFLNPTGTGNGVGTDSSGNGFNFTESFVSGGSAWATTDQFIDTPSKNFATLDSGRAGVSVVLSEGNLKQTAATDNNVQATMEIPKSGKWAFTANINATDFTFGIVSEQNSLTTKIGRTSTSWGIVNAPGASLFNVEHNSVGSFNTSQPSVNDKLIAAIDMDTNSLWLGYDTGSGFTYFGGGDPATGATPTYQGVSVSGQRLYFAIGRQLSVSFGGQSPTLYGTLPTGFLELNQDNLDDTASKITAFAWIKNRDAADNHMLFDRVRGVGKDMHSNDSAAEVTNANTVQRFLQRGVQVGNDVEVNTANESYVLWQWLLGDSATTGSANTDGSITSTVIAADAGHFSIGTYTGTGANATIGHGLSGAPELVIVKNTNDNRAWRVLETVVNGGTHYLTLNTTAASTAGSTFWNNSNPTASVINLGSDTDTNDLGDTMLAISFRSVPGVCKVGSYIGNGNADGPYVDCGFTPAFTIIKNISSAQSWEINDSGRDTYNPVSAILAADSFGTESTLAVLDYVSTGFKIRTGASVGYNGSGNTLIFLAIADIGGNGTLPPVYGR